MKGIQPVFLAGVEGPCLTALEKSTQHTGLVDFHLGVDGEHGLLLLLLRSPCTWEELRMRPFIHHIGSRIPSSGVMCMLGTRVAVAGTHPSRT